jgi:D-glycero-beta-D-manno-heptose 1-phosphate adenylyltransferase
MTPFEQKLCPSESLTARVACVPRPLVMTNGVFDLLHRGHVSYLAQARALGSSLLVAVNTDASARRLRKGPGQPLNTCDDRMAILAALESTTLITCFHEDTAAQVLERVRPDIYVKGGDYSAQSTAEGRLAQQLGIAVLSVEVVHARSTSAIINRIRSLYFR